MIFIGFLIREFGRILLKKDYKKHSDVIRGIHLYRITPTDIKKALLRV